MGLSAIAMFVEQSIIFAVMAPVVPDSLLLAVAQLVPYLH
jgi:hypothetical protein